MIQIEQHGPVTCLRMARSFLGRPIYWTAAYWVDGLLIDTGALCAAPQLLAILRQVQVDQIVLTHGHEDHIGGLAQVVKAYPQATVYASPHTIALIEEPTRLNMQLYRRVIWGVPAAVQNVRALDAIDNIVRTPHYQFHVVETPGHCRDHVCYLEPNQHWVFCGDAFIGGHDRVWAGDSDLFGAIGSLRTLVSLRPEKLFPGSGNVRRSAVAEILDKINYLTRLAGEVARLDGLGMNTDEIVACLFKEEPSITFWTRGHFSAANLVEACHSYNSIFAPIEDRSGASARLTKNPTGAPAISGTADESASQPATPSSTQQLSGEQPVDDQTDANEKKDREKKSGQNKNRKSKK